MKNNFIRKSIFAFSRSILPKAQTGQKAQDIIINLLNSPDPCMIARFGSVEIKGVLSGSCPPPLCLLFRHSIYSSLINNAGFFPVNRASVKRFSRMMIGCMQKCDCLASWRIEEFFFLKYLKQAARIPLGCLGPSNDMSVSWWNKILNGKKVLVISPFAELVEKQYNSPHRKNIWKNPEMLPDFESLATIKAENSIGGHSTFDSWFEALEHMENEIDKKDFDIALLGCGSYGFPLAAYIKGIGKKAVHIGGPLQLIFGIKGKRWDNMGFYNEFWVSPRAEDRPEGWEKVEGGCYW